MTSSSPNKPTISTNVLRDIVEPSITACGLILDDIIILGPASAPIVRITVDVTDDQAAAGAAISSDALADVSRAVNKAMDAADPIESTYMLEVSTPGAERLLKTPRHWKRHIGRLVHITLTDGTKLSGVLESADENGATVKNDENTTTIAYIHVKKARPRVELGDSDK